MSRCERGVFIDAEGYLWKKGMQITQAERGILEDYCEGAKKDSIPCRIRYMPAIQEYQAEITAYENVAKEIVLTQDCIRTKRRLSQIDFFKRELARPRKKRDPRVEKAREILGI
ncbi:MAG: hypothetical protein ACETWE_05000 [Candidatus Bathyarchaeia archaeon]